MTTTQPRRTTGTPTGKRPAASSRPAPSAGTSGSGSRTGSARRRLGATSGSLRGWLDRPLTSFHLIVAVMMLLLGIGLMMVLSSSSVMAFQGKSANSFATFQRQLIFAGIGAVGFVFAARLPLAVIRAWSTAFVMVCLVLLLALLVPGVAEPVNGSTSWIGIGAFTFQPSELAKLSLLVWSAHVCASRRSSLGSMRQLLIPILPVTALMGLLIALEPDFGTLVTLMIVLAAVMWFAGAPLRVFFGAAIVGISALVYVTVTLSPLRRNRILAFLDPQQYSAVTYQLRQGLYGMGRGGIFGVGLGESRAKWAWLPYADSDFIFAIIGEELGLVGAGIVLLLFGLLAYTGLRIARRNVDPFARIAAGAATVWLVGQASINIGYVVGALPTTGLTLPLISSGGTSLIVTMTVFGLLANLARHEPAAASALRGNGPGRVARFLGIGTHG